MTVKTATDHNISKTLQSWSYNTALLEMLNIKNQSCSFSLIPPSPHDRLRNG